MVDSPDRRTVLRTAAASLAVGFVGYLGDESLPETVPATAEAGDTVIGTPDGDQAITVGITVLDADGDPVADEPVVLHDRGGTPDDRRRSTGPDGRVKFVENVGPPPCNTQTVELPDRGVQRNMGCNNGGRQLDHTFELPETVVSDRPVVGEPPAGEHEITVDVTVINDDGAPVANEPVILRDRGGTPDDRIGKTGPGGAIRFVENVGPPPCNTQTVVLPDRGRQRRLGCNDGGVRLEQTFTLDSV